MKYTIWSVNESRTSPTNAPKTLDNRKQSILFNVATKFKTALKPTTTVSSASNTSFLNDKYYQVFVSRFR